VGPARAEDRMPERTASEMVETAAIETVRLFLVAWIG